MRAKIDRRTEASIKHGDEQLYVAKGAVKTIIALCQDHNDEFRKIERAVDELAAKGYRILAVAKGRSREKAEFVGIVALYDKPREDSRRLISELRKLGISVKMLTGDALPIAIDR